MDTVTRSEFFAKDVVNQALSELKIAVRRALPETSFAEREGAALMLLNEAGRRLLEEELQSLADGFGERLLVDGVECKRHEPGQGPVLQLGRHLAVTPATVVAGWRSITADRRALWIASRG
jgi:hypothetical protein